MALIFLLALAALVVALVLRTRVKELEDGVRFRMDGLKERIQRLEKEAGDQKGRGDATTPGAEALEVAQQAAPAPPVQAHVPLPPPARPVPPAQPAPPLAAPAGSAAAPWSFDWESLVGVKLFSWIAAIALVIAGLFFLRYSIEQGWLQPPVRMAIGILVSLTLLIVCELRVARQYRVTANSLDAAAVAILFSTFYAAYARWSLIGITPAFGLLTLVAAVAVLLAIRRDSLFIALLGLASAFATPALVSTGTDHPIGLFGYLLILDAGLSWVAYRKKWPHLVALSLVFTTIYQWSWVLTFLTAAKLPLAAAIFLVFPALGVAALAIGQAATATGSREPLFARFAGISVCLPQLFALYLAAVPAYAAHVGLLFGFLLILDIALFGVAAMHGSEWLHLAGGLTTLVVMWTWVSSVYPAAAGAFAWPMVLAFVVLFVVFYLTAPIAAQRMGRPFVRIGSHSVLAAPILLFVFPAFAASEPACAEPWLLFSVLFGLLAAIAWAAVFGRRGTLHFIAAFFALVAEAVWSAKYLTPDRLPAGLILYGVFGLFYLAVPLAARRAERPFEPEGAAGILLLVSHVFLLFVASRPDLAVPPWPMIGVLAVLDLAVGAAALHSRRGALHVAAAVATQLILITWAAVAAGPPWPTVAIISSGAFVALACVWTAMAGRLGLDKRPFDSAVIAATVLGQLVVLIAGLRPGAPGVGVLAASHVALILVLLAVAARRQRHRLAIVSVILPAFAVILWQGTHAGTEDWLRVLAFASPIYLTFILAPLVLGKRVTTAIEPYQAAVLAGIPFFLVARPALYQGGFGGIIGALPLVQTALTATHLAQLLRLEEPGGRRVGRLALVAGTALAYVTLAVPLQLEKEWITIAWALEGAALAWLYVRIPHRGLYWSAVVLMSVVFVRLALNPEVLVYQARGSVRIWNWYLYTYVMAAASMLFAAWSLMKVDDRTVPGLPRASTLMKAAATILLFLLLNVEIADFFATGKTITFNFSATLVQDLTYTLGWGVFGVGLLALGIVLRSRPARVGSLGLLIVTVCKCFLHDLARLTGLYRVASFVGLAICLALVAVVLQRFVLARRPEDRP